MRGRHQVRSLELEVVDRHARQLTVEALPRPAVVERHPGARLGPGVEQAGPHGVRADHARELLVREALGDAAPGRAVVLGLVQVGRAVLKPVAVGGQIDRAGVVRGRLERDDGGPLAERGWRDLLPALAIVTRDVHAAVVRAGPEHAGLEQRLGEREDGAVDLGARGVLVDRPARGAKLLGVVAGQVGADRPPGVAVVARAEDALAAGVEHVGIVRRERDGEGPLEAVLLRSHVLAEVVLRPDRDELRLLRAAVVAQQRTAAPAGAADGARVDHVAVLGVHGDVAALREADPIAVVPGDEAAPRAARHADGRVVLLRGVNAVGELVVDVDVVELPGRLVEDGREGVAAVVRDAGPAVVALDHAPRISGVDPQVVVVAVRCSNAPEAAAAVGRALHREVHAVERVGVDRVGDDVAVVPGPANQGLLRADPLPAVAAVLGAVEPALPLCGLDHGPDPTA